MTFEYLLNSTNQSAKPTDLTTIFFPFNNVFSFFSFLISYTSNAIIDMVEFYFPGKSALKCV